MPARTRRAENSRETQSALLAFDEGGPVASLEACARRLARDFDEAASPEDRVNVAKGLRLILQTINARRTRVEKPPPKAPALKLVEDLRQRRERALEG